LRGEGTVVKSEPCRRSVKAFGAVSVEYLPAFHFMFADKFNSQSFLKFIRRIVSHARGVKVFFITDNARYHHSRVVRDWVDSNSDKIELHFLPPYSPNLNAQEHVWRLTKRSATHNRHFASLSELKQRVFRRFNRFQGNPGRLRSAITRFLPAKLRKHAKA
jgi:transposase